MRKYHTSVSVVMSDVTHTAFQAFSEVSAEFSLAATFFLRLKEFMMELHIS